jgi:hypothetical protein
MVKLLLYVSSTLTNYNQYSSIAPIHSLPHQQQHSGITFTVLLSLSWYVYNSQCFMSIYIDYHVHIMTYLAVTD